MKHSFVVFSVLLMMFSCSKKNNETAEKVQQNDTLKQKSGVVISYAKTAKKLLVLKRDETIYSEAYQQRLRKIAEYYVANSQKSLLKFHKEKPDAQLGFSMEENDWEDVQYTQIGIFSKSGSNATTLQWLFYEPNSQKLYEFDLHTKKLAEFPLK